MNIGDDVLRILPELRAQAESLMVDTCVITRGGTGPGTWDESTGVFVPPAGATVYSGRCKLQTANVQISTPDVAGREAYIVSEAVHLPVIGSESVRQGDLVTMTACDLDAAVVGKTFTVQGPHVGSTKTARRLPVKAEVASWP